jgi:hypothetical protein
MGQPRRGKGFGVREEKVDDGSREDPRIFEVVDGNRGEEGRFDAGRAAGRILVCHFRSEAGREVALSSDVGSRR